MKIRFFRVITIITLSLAFVVAGIPFSESQVNAATNTVTANSVTSTNWMGFLPNNASLGQINIPATHDSGCTDFLTADLVSLGILKPLAKTQNLNFVEQLNAGIRKFDIRLARPEALAGYTDELVLNHGGVAALRVEGHVEFLTITDVVRYCRDFLKNHPTETVILRWNSESSPCMDTDKNGRYGELINKFINKLKATGDIVLEKNDKIPTLGEARGKIVAFDTNIMKKDDIEYASISGEQKWDGGYDDKLKWFNGIKYYFDRAKEQDYTKEITMLGDSTENGLQFIGTDCYMTLMGIPLWRDDPMVAGYVNEKLLNYGYKKGYYYGWVSMDFVTEELARTIYMTNIFDFDENDGKISYISDIAFAYDQEINYAKSILEGKGYTVFDENFNPEGPDKIFSDAVVNGRRNKGSFNLALGYKTTTNPMKAITGLKWIHLPMLASTPTDDVLTYIKDGNYKQVQSLSSFEYGVEDLKNWTDYELSSFNIGTLAPKVNLLYTKDQTAGERLYSLESLQTLHKTQKDSDEDEMIQDMARDYLNSGFKSPRDVENYLFASNYGRNEQDDVYLFYKQAFPGKIPVLSKEKEFIYYETIDMGYDEVRFDTKTGTGLGASKYLIKHTKPKINKLTKSKGKVKLQIKNLKWDSVENRQIATYQIYRSTSKKFNKNLKKFSFKARKTSGKNLFCKDKNRINSGSKYYYKIRGKVKLSNGKTYYTRWSKIKTIN